MPWINKEQCVGCGACVASCTASAISLDNEGKAEIENADCIRCGVCHDMCPVSAVRHDSERIPADVADNLEWIQRLMTHFTRDSESTAFLGRVRRYFGKEKTVAVRTIEALEGLGESPKEELNATIQRLRN